MTNFDTIRATIFRDCADAYDALAALAELERQHYTPEDMADASAKGFRAGVESVTAGQEPVAWLRKNGFRFLGVAEPQDDSELPLYAAPVAQQPQYEAADMASAAAQGFRDGVASVAQQPQTRPDFDDEWTGYLKDGETPFERFLRERKDLNALTKLYQRALEENERLKAQQPQAEAVQYTRADLDRAYSAGLVEGERLAIQQAEAVRWERKNDAGHWVNVPLGDEHFWAKCGSEMRTKAAPQQAEAVPLDMGVMELAESVGLIGPASRTDDFHAAIQRFHDLISMNVSIKAAVHFAQGLPKKGGAA